MFSCQLEEVGGRVYSGTLEELMQLAAEERARLVQGTLASRFHQNHPYQREREIKKLTGSKQSSPIQPHLSLAEEVHKFI